ncbi:hypothetical protein AB0958_43620 [Streptomyces sp. NPDC006655]
MALGGLLVAVRGVALVALRTLGAHHLVQPGRQLALSLVVGVL